MHGPNMYVLSSNLKERENIQYVLGKFPPSMHVRIKRTGLAEQFWKHKNDEYSIQNDPLGNIFHVCQYFDILDICLSKYLFSSHQGNKT